MNHPLDFDSINRAALVALPAVLNRVLPSGKTVHKEWVALNPRRRDRNLGSFRVNRYNGKWADFATGDKGGDAARDAAVTLSLALQYGTPADANRKAIMEAAHFMARWREGNGKTYRERFAEALRYEWKQAKARNLPINPAVTQETIATTICTPGWTKTVRPSARYTARIKIKLIRELEIPEELLVDFELDHRIPLALGGAPSEERNLELQPWDEAVEKDRIETCLSRAVCAGTITLDEARRRIWADWRAVGKVCQ
jgi:hypothetical protein